MKCIIPVLAVLLFVTAAEAKRARRTPVNTPTGVLCSDWRLEAWGKGFAVCPAASPEGKDRIVAFDADGTNPKTLVQAPAPFSEWKASPKELHVAWIVAGKLHLTSPAEGVHRELGDADGGLAFSPDGKVVAFLSKGSLVLQDVAGDRRRVVAPRPDRRLIAPVAFSGDGKSIFVLTSTAKTKEAQPPDAIARADAGAEAPELSLLHECEGGEISSLVASPGTALVAFLEKGKGAAVPSIRLLDAGTGQFHDYTSAGDFRSVAFDAGGLGLLVCVAGKGGVEVCAQQLFRSGTARVYWRESLTVPGPGDALHPAAGAGGAWFLRRGKDGLEWEVVRASVE